MLEEISSPNFDLPNGEVKYQQNMEEMKQLIPFIREEMKACPSEHLTFNLTETVDFYSLKRHFKFKTNSNDLNEQNLSKFKDTFLINISSLDSFIVIPQKNSYEINVVKNKGNEFKSPLVYNIEGDEVSINLEGEEEKFLFLYENMNDLILFLEKNQNSEKKIICLGLNLDFFEQKKYLKKNGFINKNNFQFYFINLNPENKNTSELNFNNLPRILIIGENNIISEDKTIKDNNFEIEKIISEPNEDKKIKNEERRKKDSNFILLDNENKRKVIKAINIYINELGVQNVHFYVKSKISLDNKGISKTRCYPIFYGDTNKEGKELIDNLIKSLDGQELFHDIQNKINII